VPPAKRPQKMVDLPRSVLARVLTVMTLAAVSGSLIFNFTTNGNGQLLTERLHGVVDDPASIGALLAVVYTVASFAQLIVGKLIDRVPLKWRSEERRVGKSVDLGGRRIFKKKKRGEV